MIRVQHLSKHFCNVKAVDDISFEVKEHENLILLGTSGCGKTTTLKMLNRLIEADSGEIAINGKSIKGQSPEALRIGIGYVLQNNGLFPHYTVAQNIAIVPQLLKWDKKKIENRTAELLEKLHLSVDYLKAYPPELSGGQQQRVGLARALAADPAVLLMDEPFAALDNVTRSKIHAEFKALDELKRKTIIMVTHDVQEAFELGDRICLMDKGRIVQDGTPAELLFKPKNDFVKEFLKEQRLLLEFKTITVKSLWHLLSNEEIKGMGPGILVDYKVDLWTVLERATFFNAERLNMMNLENKEMKTVSFESLTAAFYQYKKQQAHE
ncbi:ABC transporter ATP-binding protein [Mucilaginibacter sp. X4EP1]|uniref:ABC transporter ATP-binding protein n=1 Tax=Mucilaginibacter sp. X4EP1 TaxID=2723092 RepID=UPI00216A4761|nr:ABC transporter ATP-binding protein [Mucilaginibacter sp. X4EP1]MCS3811435.1 osmoprotectant transport system ATP-binding protein [Mucilaginibacter sp. X4EP1]